MKKFFTLAFAAAICAGTINAQKPTLTFLGAGPEETPTLMGLGISPNGKYVCGSTNMGSGYFVADIENNTLADAETVDENEGAELRDVDDNGLAIGYDGPGITFSIDGARAELVVPPSEYKYVLGEDLTDDGKMMVGSLVAKGYGTYAAYSVKGEWTLLPVPTDEAFVYYTDGDNECAAKYVSGDGKVILGYMGNWGPAMGWIKNEAGKYEVLPLYDQVAITDEDYEAGTKPYAGLMPMGVSNNGKYMVMAGTTLSEDYSSVIVVYNTETKEFTNYDWKDEEGQGLSPAAIADDGTIVAYTGRLGMSSTCNYIIPAGQTVPVSFAELLPEYAEMFMVPDMMGYHIATGISADGNLVIGYLYYADDYYDEEAEGYFRTYVINRSSEEATLTFLGAGPDETPMLMGLGISPNGKYVCGSTNMGGGYFVADIENNTLADAETVDENEGSELRHVDNNGLAIGYDGPGITFSITGERTELVVPNKYKYVLGEGLTADGSLMVGSLVGKGYGTYAAYSVAGGEWTLLPVPTDEAFVYYTDGDNQCAAKYVSGDGKVILGYMGNWGPAMAWLQNEAGEYEVLPLYDQVAITDEDYEACTKPYVGLMPMGVSNNGKYMVMAGTTLSEDYSSVIVVYNTETKEFSTYDWKDEEGQGLSPAAIADDGTIVAYTGRLGMLPTCNYIIPAGQTVPVSFAELLPEYAEMFMVPDMMGYHIATDISADGNLIIGYLYYADDYYDEEAEGYFRTYVINRVGETDGISNAATDAEATPAAYYTIDGKRLTAPQPGLNIVRMTDGSARKVIVK